MYLLSNAFSPRNPGLRRLSNATPRSANRTFAFGTNPSRYKSLPSVLDILNKMSNGKPVCCPSFLIWSARKIDSIARAVTGTNNLLTAIIHTLTHPSIKSSVSHTTVAVPSRTLLGCDCVVSVPTLPQPTKSPHNTRTVIPRPKGRNGYINLSNK